MFIVNEIKIKGTHTHVDCAYRDGAAYLIRRRCTADVSTKGCHIVIHVNGVLFEMTNKCNNGHVITRDQHLPLLTTHGTNIT